MKSTQNFYANQTSFQPVVIRKSEPSTRCESAERCLIGSQLSTPTLIPKVAKLGILPADFAEFGLAEIQTAIRESWNRFRCIDAAFVRQELIDSLGRAVQPAAFLAELALEFHGAIHWRFHAAQVAQACYVRLLERNAAEFLKALRDRSNRPAEIEALRQDQESERMAMVARLESVL